MSLPSDREILITRTFAPASVVFEAWTTPDHVKQWYSDDAAPVVACDIDLRVGGSWRYVTRAEDGTQFAWHGTYQEIDAPRRLVSTEVFEGFPDAEAVNTLALEERNGTTTLTVNVLHANKENRDGHVNSGMEGGMQQALDRLEDLVAVTTS